LEITFWLDAFLNCFVRLGYWWWLGRSEWWHANVWLFDWLDLFGVSLIQELLYVS